MRLRLSTSLLVVGVLLCYSLFFIGQRAVPNLVFEGHPLAVTALPLTQSDTAASLPVRVIFVGDIQFDRFIRQTAKKHGWDYLLSSDVRRRLQAADLVLGNLEGPITEASSLSLGSQIGERTNYIFTFPPESAAFLARENIRLVNLGNNHILNFGEDGVRQTKTWLEQSGVGYFGSPLAGDERICIREIHGIRFAFVNYNQFISQGEEKALTDIATARSAADFVIVYTHWGQEYVGASTEVKALAHLFVDAGADLVIGSHPHVVQEKEEYRGKMIYYSLGNFIFDQYFRPETRRGLLVQATFHSDTHTLETEDIPITLNRTGQTMLAEPH